MLIFQFAYGAVVASPLARVSHMYTATIKASLNFVFASLLEQSERHETAFHTFHSVHLGFASSVHPQHELTKSVIQVRRVESKFEWPGAFAKICPDDTSE